MSEIEKIKLYQNAGIEPTYTDECIVANKFWGNEELANEYGTFDKFMEKNCKFGYQDCTDECEYAYTKTHYPPFTAEKQIELIKYFSNNYNISINKDNNIFRFLFINKDGIHNFYTSGVDFAESLALFVISRYKNQILTEEEKQQIKEILNE